MTKVHSNRSRKSFAGLHRTLAVQEKAVPVLEVRSSWTCRWIAAAADALTCGCHRNLTEIRSTILCQTKEGVLHDHFKGAYTCCAEYMPWHPTSTTSRCFGMGLTEWGIDERATLPFQETNLCLCRCSNATNNSTPTVNRTDPDLRIICSIPYMTITTGNMARTKHL
mmetsp:Transcript_7993/g.12233  ORF Transcript_7993/g.12233 Transcript_7993/m.12233 type:complete len:167 (+) Transcript_7993:104-604(+)